MSTSILHLYWKTALFFGRGQPIVPPYTKPFSANSFSTISALRSPLQAAPGLLLRVSWCQFLPLWSRSLRVSPLSADTHRLFFRDCSFPDSPKPCVIRPDRNPVVAAPLLHRLAALLAGADLCLPSPNRQTCFDLHDRSRFLFLCHVRSPLLCKTLTDYGGLFGVAQSSS